MKTSKIFLIACLALIGFASCKKDHDDPKKDTSIEGKWIGTYTSSASGNTFFYSFNIKAGGIIEELDNNGQKIGQGTWKLENDIFSARYYWAADASGFSALAAFNRQQAKLLGDWGYGTSATNGGTWQMSKN